MTPPVDILALADAEHEQAARHLQNVSMMAESPEAWAEYDAALLWVRRAKAGRQAARRLVDAIGEAA